MANLLEETLSALAEAGRGASQVAWVGSRDGKIAVPWVEFSAIAAGCKYDEGYGNAEIATDLVVVGEGGGWWLERIEYDGAEGWTYAMAPVLSVSATRFERVMREDCGTTKLAGVDAE